MNNLPEVDALLQLSEKSYSSSQWRYRGRVRENWGFDAQYSYYCLKSSDLDSTKFCIIKVFFLLIGRIFSNMTRRK
jgi:hypothetical protein